MEKFAYTTPGPRKNNEDYYAIEHINESDVFCVADGVGGNLCGEFASKFSTNRFISEVASAANPKLKVILQNINEELKAEALKKKECKGMATTFTAILVQNNFVQLIHTGDSRLYLLRGNGLKQLTEDHTEVKRLLKEGLLTPDTAQNYTRKNVLDSALGVDGELKTTFLSFNTKIGDRLLISTDGFHGVFSKTELRDISIVNPIFESFCDVLVSKLEKKMLIDNATFISVEFGLGNGLPIR